MNKEAGPMRAKNSNFHLHLEKRISSFTNSFSKVKNRAQMRDVHKLRVSIKNLRTINRLLCKVDPENFPENKIEKHTKPIFKTAGRLRELQLKDRMLKNEKAKYLLSYKTLLKEERKLAKKKLQLRMHAFDNKEFKAITRQMTKESKEINDQMIISKCKAILRSENKTVGRLIQSSDDDTIHKTRIHIRTLREILAIVMKIDPAYPAKETAAQLKAVSLHLGLWHDYVDLSNSLEYFLEKYTSGREKNLYRGLLSRVQKKQATELEKAKIKLQAYQNSRIQ